MFTAADCDCSSGTIVERVAESGLVRSQLPLRSDGLVSQQQPKRQYLILTVDEQRLLAARWTGLALRFIALWDVVGPF